MAAKTFGTAHLYGIDGSVTNATVTSFSINKSHQLEDSTVNESGQVIERRYDDTLDDVSIGIKIQAAYTEPAIGTTISYDSVTYELTGLDKSEEAQGYKTYTYKAKKSEYITYV